MQTLQGQLLIATPGLLAPFFARSVILMLEHGSSGAVGLVLNRPTETTVADIAGEIFGEPLPWDKALMLGGPVSGPLMVLHQDPTVSDQEVIPGVFRVIESDKIRSVLFARLEPTLVVVNYAGWGPGQLEGEFELDSWMTLPATSNLIFWNEPGDLWEATIRRANARKLTQFLGLDHTPEDPLCN